MLRMKVPLPKSHQNGAITGLDAVRSERKEATTTASGAEHHRRTTFTPVRARTYNARTKNSYARTGMGVTPSPFSCESCHVSPPPPSGSGEISKYAHILQGVAQGRTPTPTLFKVYINDVIVAVEAAKSKESRWGKIRCWG